MSTRARRLIVEVDDGKVYRITLDRAEKKNALTPQMLQDAASALRSAAKSHSTLTVVAGKGDYFCAGADLSSDGLIADSEEAAKHGKMCLERFINALIDHPKPLLALVHGPAIGIGVIMLSLFDTVYASDRATFHIPLTSLGLTPAGCSSHTFPRLMGFVKTSDMILFGTKLTAEEAERRHLVSDIFPQSEFKNEAEKRIKRFSELPRESLLLSKKLMRDWVHDKLHRANSDEQKLIETNWDSPERRTAFAKFASRRSSHD